MPHQKVCLQCGTHFLAQSPKGKYCSRACFGLSRRNRVEFVCRCCGKRFELKRFASTQSDSGHFCSGECLYKSRYEFIKRRLARFCRMSTADALRYLYVTRQMSYRDICALFGINNRTVPRLLKDHNIPIRRGSSAIKTQWTNGKHNHQSGSDHYAWRGGFSYSQFHDMPRAEWFALSDQIRARDGHACTCCQIPESEYSRILDVHHVVPYQLSKSNHSDNLRTLCSVCHTRKDREFIWLL